MCERKKLKVNVGKSRVMVCAKIERRKCLNLKLNGKILEEADPFNNLGSNI